MTIRKKCPVCPKKYTMSSSLSRHITAMVNKGDKAHMEYRGVQAKAEPLPLQTEKAEEKSLTFASPPSVKKEPDAPVEAEGLPGPSDDLEALKLPGPEDEVDYVPPIEGISAMGEVPYDNWQQVLEYTGDIVIAFGKGDVDSLTKMNKADYAIMAKHIATSRGQDLSPAMAASVIYLKFVVFLISNVFKGASRVMEKRKIKMAKKAEEEAEEQRKVSEDGSIDRPEGA